jgi:hypothetical protein
MSREEAGIKALTDWYADEPWRHRQDVKRVLTAADAHDRANGIHRIALDDATVGRCADAAESIHERWGSWEDVARAVLAAAVKEEQA